MDVVREALRRTRAILTDFGTESGIVDCPDLVPFVLTAVYKYRGMGPPSIPLERYLFPFALAFPGVLSIAQTGGLIGFLGTL